MQKNGRALMMPMEDATERFSRLCGRAAWLLLAAALLFSFSVRCRLLQFPLERDEGEYAYAGQLLLEGVPPYKMAYNMKLPGTYAAYAAIMAVFGQTTAGIHAGLLVVNLATIVLVFFLARDLFDPLAGGFAAAAYAFLAIGPSVLGMAAHATHFVTLFGVAGAWVLWRAIRSDKTAWMFLSGILFGIALLMKQQGVFLIGFGALTAVVCAAVRRPFAWRPLLVHPAMLLAGAVLPYLATCFWLLRAGVFENFWLWTVAYAQEYVRQTSLKLGALYFWYNFSRVLAATWPLWLAAAAGIAIAWRRKDVREACWFATAYFVFSFLCVCPGFFFRNHYFIIWLPAVAIFSGVACSKLMGFAAWRWLRDGEERRRPVPQSSGSCCQKYPASNDPAGSPSGSLFWLVCFVFAAATVLMILWQSDYFLFASPEQICRKTYFPNPFIESSEVADYIRRHSTPEQRIAVIGSEPQIYFYAKRISATGYIYTYPLVEDQPFAPKMQREMCREIEAASPKFLVLVNVPTSWMAAPVADRFIFQWAEDYVKTAYRSVGIIDIFSRDAPSESCWGDQAADARPRSLFNVWVFERKS